MVATMASMVTRNLGNMSGATIYNDNGYSLCQLPRCKHRRDGSGRIFLPEIPFVVKSTPRAD
jgi:hypothetical protein